jgi:hypothetical protein
VKLALIVCIYQRHDLERIVLNRFKNQAKKFGIEIVVVGSEGVISKQLADGCHYIECDNYPLSYKHQSGLDYARTLNVDGVLVFGSDDIASDSYFEFIKKFIGVDYLVGLKDFYFYSTKEKQLYYFEGYESETSLGAGRLYTKEVLDKIGWKLWGTEQRNKALDALAKHNLGKQNIKEELFNQKDLDILVCDVKHTRNITNHSFLNTLKKVMAKKKQKEELKEVSELQVPEAKKIDLSTINDKEIYRFIPNGKSKHLGLDAIMVTGEMAKLFMEREYGTID